VHEWLLLVVGLLLTLGTGLFVASEFALVNLDRSDLEKRQERGEKRLGPPIRALRITSTHLSSAQLGITLTTLLTGYTMEPALSLLLAEPLTSAGLAEGLVSPVSTVVALVVATLLSMIVGELVPKNFALALPRETAKLVIPFQTLFTTVFKPAVLLLNNSANGILRLVGIEPKEELSGARSAEELSSLVRRSALAGLLEDDTAMLLSRTLRFADLTASDVMTPRLRVKSVERTDSAQTVIELAMTTGYSRFPVTDDGVDDVIGLVHVKQAVAVPREKRALVPVTALQSEAIRVPETMKLADEHDRTRAGVVRSRDSLTFPGMLRPDELLERTGLRIPSEGPYETAAGFVMSELGRLPVVGDELELETGTLRVERLDGRRIDRIRFTPVPEPVATAVGTTRAERQADRQAERQADREAGRQADAERAAMRKEPSRG
jgi:CBS domain containing-hemolysin-like protein